ncbi:hypothetical protein [Streptomyces sp. NPDC048516]|uniref:hypothetical protein n=1 Tax=Streptomyces sp. NPDC048516 TaxID=3365565 RepID=UPI0037151E77
MFTGGYIEAIASPKGDLDLPGRWVDWENRVPGPSWISLAWRAQDDRLHTGARTTLDRLLNTAHTEPYDVGEIDWPSWRTFVASLGDPQLTMAGLRPDLWAVGHSTTKTAAVIQQDGLILADAPDSPSLSTLDSPAASCLCRPVQALRGGFLTPSRHKPRQRGGLTDEALDRSASPPGRERAAPARSRSPARACPCCGGRWAMWRSFRRRGRCGSSPG